MSGDATTVFMHDLDARFQAVSGLSDRRDYSIFYSRVVPSRVMVIGIKPGGRRDGSHQLASQTFYEDDAHEYVDMDYRIAAVMRPALMYAFEAVSADQLRGIPKTNCFFQRAVGTDDFSSTELRQNAALCAPFLGEMIAAVSPDVLIMEGVGARDLILRHQCRDVREDVDQRIVGERRGALNTFFRRETAWMSVLNRRVTILTLGHPSQFGHLPTWSKVVAALRNNLGPQFLGSVVSCAPSSLNSPNPVTGPPAEAKAPANIEKTLAPDRTRTNDKRMFTAAQRPPGSFSYRPIHDFWQELLKTGAMDADAFYDHLLRVRWSRPSGKPLTPQVVRTDLVSMVKHGFASVAGSR